MSHVAVCSLYLPKSFNFINAFACYKQKCKLAPFNLAHPVVCLGKIALALFALLTCQTNDVTQHVTEKYWMKKAHS